MLLLQTYYRQLLQTKSDGIRDPAEAFQIHILVVPEHFCTGVADQCQLVLVRSLDSFHQGGEGVTAAVGGVLPALDAVDLRGGIGDPAGIQHLVEHVPVVFDREAAAVGLAEERAADLVGGEPVDGGLDLRGDGHDAVLAGFRLGTAGEGLILSVIVGNIQIQQLRGAEAQIALRHNVVGILLSGYDLDILPGKKYNKWADCLDLWWVGFSARPVDARNIDRAFFLAF